MSTPSGVLQAQLDSLLQLVERERADQCARIQADARSERQRILHKAHRDARRRMHEAIEEERRRAEHQLQSAEAELRARNREHQQKMALLMLHRGWEALHEALVARWRDPVTQREWCRNLLQCAQQVLSSGHWNIEHPSGWSEAAATKFADSVQELTGHPPTLSPNGDLGAGLRICSGTACVDATVGEPGTGLMADRTAAEARLLAHLHYLLAERREEGQ